MIGLIFRIFFTVIILAGVLFLLAGSLIVAAIVTPVIILLIYFFGRRSGIQVWSVRTGQTSQRGRSPQGPVIDHDPNDLPPDTPTDERKDN